MMTSLPTGGRRIRPALATIAPNIPFLDALAARWRRQVADNGDGDPSAFAEGQFLLPTRRAARGLSEAFLRGAAGAPLLLPRIVAIGGLDETPLGLPGTLALNPPVEPTRRLAILTTFILGMAGGHGAPQSPDRAWLLASELADLLDEAARAEIDLAAVLPQAAGRDFAAHWDVTLRFLSIVTRAWPAWLAEEGLSDVAAHRIAIIDAQCDLWRAMPPASAVIAAGITGANPAEARLLDVIAHLPQGVVVLPGLDLILEEASWAALDDTHPQASLRALLNTLHATRGDVEAWIDHPAAAPAGRVDAWRLALLPAASLGAWQPPPPLDTLGLTRLDAADQQEEAVATALVLREALAEPGTRVALVTPDRLLAQRVTAELLRFGVVADDSAGEELAETPPAVFLRLLAQAVAEDLRPVPLLALLKHPFCAAGLAPAACRGAARSLERDCLRGGRPGPGIEGLRRRGGGASFLDRLSAVFDPLLDRMGKREAPPVDMLRRLIQVAEKLASTDTQPGAARLWAGEDGEALASHLAALADGFASLPDQRLETMPGLLEAALAGVAVRSRRALRGRDGVEHPRVVIWGLLEARLQTADLIVLGGLSEHVWPPLADPGPWMNRAMRREAGLSSPEQAVGFAAHDFISSACAAPRVVLAAPRRRDGAPAVPSRWLVRLEALLEGGGATLVRHQAAVWAQALDRPKGAAAPVAPPAPAPAVALRPRNVRVTEIETWLGDPYAVYARYVLKLEKLKPLEESADAADYGSIVHDGMHRFYKKFDRVWPPDAQTQLGAAMQEALDAAGMRQALVAWWQPRLQRIGAWVAEAEADRRAHGPPALIRPEQKGIWTFEAPAGPFSLRGRADRIERRGDGGLAILDYKTGVMPSQKDVEDGRAPQLPLEAAMLYAGAFGEDVREHAGELTYWHISGGYRPGAIRVLFKADAALVRSAAEDARSKLHALVTAFDVAERAYLSQPYPGAAPRFSEFAHLARVAEWAAVEDTEAVSSGHSDVT